MAKIDMRGEWIVGITFKDPEYNPDASPEELIKRLSAASSDIRPEIEKYIRLSLKQTPEDPEDRLDALARHSNTSYSADTVYEFIRNQDRTDQGLTTDEAGTYIGILHNMAIGDREQAIINLSHLIEREPLNGEFNEVFREIGLKYLKNLRDDNKTVTIHIKNCATDILRLDEVQTEVLKLKHPNLDI